MSRIRDDNFYTVLGWMLNVLDLKGNELIVFAIVYSFSQDGESEWKGSLTYLEDFANISRPTAVSALANLVKKGYILKRTFEMQGTKMQRTAYRVNYEKIDAMKAGLQQLLPNNDGAESG
ncbi:MAG: helix-turn-helix domain-containing protein [Clostridia bacterium]|nr:helix-turn-helix domain-containing protein [Clostridia bacterium]